MTIEAPSTRGSAGVPTNGSPPLVLPDAPESRVTLYRPFPVATLVGTEPLKTVIVSPAQQGCGPVPTMVPATVVTEEAGAGDSRWTMMLLSAVGAGPEVITA